MIKRDSIRVDKKWEIQNLLDLQRMIYIQDNYNLLRLKPLRYEQILEFVCLLRSLEAGEYNTINEVLKIMKDQPGSEKHLKLVRFIL